MRLPSYVVLSCLLASGCADNASTTKAEPSAEPRPKESAAPPLASEAAAPASASGSSSATAHDVPPDSSAKPAAGPIPAPSDVAEPPADAKKAASGLATKVLKPGTGKVHPKPTDRVTAHYTGWTKDGQMFDSSVQRGEPLVFALGEVIKGWTEGIQLMVAGEQRRLWIPANLAYGDKPSRPGAPTGQLTFDVELIDIREPPKTPTVPEDLKKPPATAKKTESGLVYRVLTKGKGTAFPKATDNVKVHYSGWTLDGKMFDSSIMRDEPAVFPLNHVIKGWTEGVQLMNVGDKVRFWIPADLAYGDKAKRPGAPSGPLVFDIELIAIP